MGKSIQKERIGRYEIFVKEFYAKMTVIHLKKKDIVKSNGENRRRDDDEATQEEEAEGEDEGNRVDFGGRRSLMRQAVEGESGSGRSSMILKKMLEALGSADEIRRDATPIRFDGRTRA
ncbi:hypothetical protein Dimus_033616 [Dionaea muscipula]